MNRVLCIILLTVFNSAYSEPLVLFNWSDYIEPEVIAEFTQQTGIEIKEIFYDSDESRDEALARSSGKGYDLIVMNGLTIDSYRKQGWLAPINTKTLSNLKHIDKRWKEAFPSSKEYAMPYFWGTTGIAYRKDLIKSPINSWQQLFDPADDLKGKITMLNSPREIISVSLKALGYSGNSSNKAEFSAALKLMHKQSEFVNSYIGVDLDENSALLSGKTVAAMMYSGDALMLQELNENIEYVLPKEGSNIWVDYFTVSAFSLQKEKAWQFINFINQPKVAAKIASFVYCASPNKGARKLLDEEYLTNPTIFPTQVKLKNSEFFKQLPARSLKKLTKNFQQMVK